MMILWIILIAVLVALLWLFISKGSQGTTPNNEDESIRILRKRFANGEISSEEFEERLRELEREL
ncbi:MAG: hypothetical protein CMN32_06445 [Saprospirales bacterium]|jgi:uncharacterized membrane protein|nr:hypothetical protein [Saprospirales bacterium]